MAAEIVAEEEVVEDFEGEVAVEETKAAVVVALDILQLCGVVIVVVVVAEAQDSCCNLAVVVVVVPGNCCKSLYCCTFVWEGVVSSERTMTCDQEEVQQRKNHQQGLVESPHGQTDPSQQQQQLVHW